MLYVKSIFTNQVYEVEFFPHGIGWEWSTKEEYEKQQKNM